MLKRLLLGLTLLTAAAAASADGLRVVATTASMGALVRAVAGDRAEVDVLAPPDRDVHYLQARPSMIRDLRRADLVVAVGAELEVGWLPVAIQQAANPAILPGRDGYFEAAAQVDLLGVGAEANRAHGDVHPAGNPHIYLDPLRMAEVASALAGRLAALDTSNAARYRAGAEAFAAAVQQRLPQWRARVADAPGALLYHKDADYLLTRLDVPSLGYIEPVPGIPPTASHIRELVERLAGSRGVIIHAPYYSPQAPRRLADALGWPRVALGAEPPLGSDGAGYLEHIDRWVEALAKAP